MLHETPPHLVEQLVDSVPTQLDPDCVIDLGSGHGALLAKAMDRFPNATAIGVDIDQASNAHARRKLGAKATIITADATKLDSLSRKLRAAGLRASDAILFVGNPPFCKNKRWKPEGAAVNIDAVFRAKVSPAGRKALPYQFFVNQLALVADQGHIANIMPSTWVTGQTWEQFRAECAIQYRLTTTHLGYHRFSGKEVGVALVAVRPGTSRAVRANQPRHSLAPYIESVTRGKPVRAVPGNEQGRLVLHSSSNGIIVRPVRRIMQGGSGIDQQALAFIRVSRAAGRLLHVPARMQHLPLTDCLAAVQVNGADIGALSLIFWSDQYSSELQVPKRGTGARFLTYADISKLRLPRRFQLWEVSLKKSFNMHRATLLEDATPFFRLVQEDLAQARIPLTFNRIQQTAASWTPRA